MRGGFFLVLMVWSAAAAAQTMYKCLDGQRRVTYSNVSCEKQGLTDGGPVAERTTSMPFTAPPKPAPRTATGARAEPAERGAPAVRSEPIAPALSKDDAEAGRGAVQVKPASPLIQKLVD